MASPNATEGVARKAQKIWRPRLCKKTLASIGGRGTITMHIVRIFMTGADGYPSYLRVIRICDPPIVVPFLSLCHALAQYIANGRQ